MPSYPASLFLGAVGVAVEAGEDGARRHQLAGLVPAVCVAQSSGVALTLLIQDGVQSGRQRGHETTSLLCFTGQFVKKSHVKTHHMKIQVII